MKSIRINKKLPNKEIKLEKDVFYYTDNELIKLLNVTLTKLCKIHLLPVKGTKKMMSSRLIKFKDMMLKHKELEFLMDVDSDDDIKSVVDEEMENNEDEEEEKKSEASEGFSQRPPKKIVNKGNILINDLVMNKIYADRILIAFVLFIDPLKMVIKRADQTELAIVTIMLGFRDVDITTTLTLWQEQAYQYRYIKENDVIAIKSFETKSKSIYTTTNSSFILRLFGNNGEIEVLEDSINVNLIKKYSFIDSIVVIASLPVKTIIDVIAIIRKIYPEEEIILKLGGTTKRRKIILYDDKGSITCMLWRNQVDLLDISNEENVIALKAAQVSQWDGRSITLNGVLNLNPDISSTQSVNHILEMKQEERDDLFNRITSLSSNNYATTEWDKVKERTIFEIIEMEISVFREKVEIPIKFQSSLVRGSISRLISAITYFAEDNNGQQTILYQNGDGTFSDRNHVQYENAKHKYNLVFILVDTSCEKQMKLTAFEKVAFDLMSVSVDEFVEVREKDPKKYNEIIEKFCTRFGLFGLQTKLKVVGNQRYINHTCAYFQV